jgi:hypothetical protein
MPLDAHEFRQAYLELKFAGDGLEKDLREGIKWAGQGAVEAVKAESSFSRKIPPATRLKISFAARGAGISVVVNAAQAPNARPINHGGRGGVFRHPVFGHRDRWVDQAAHPFINAAANAPSIEEGLRQVLDHVAFHAGFK